MTLPTRLRAALLLIATVAATLLGALAISAPAHADNPPGTDDPWGTVFGVAARPDGSIRFVGWGADPNDLKHNATVYTLLDGRILTGTPTDQARPGIAEQLHTGPTAGFDVDVPVPSGAHTACVAIGNVGAGLSRLLRCVSTPFGSSLSSAQWATHSPQGKVLSATATATTMRLTGWAIEPDFHARRVVVVVYVDGVPATTVNTTWAGPKLRGLGAGPRGAFDITVPVSPGAHLGCVWLVDVGFGDNTGLGCSTVDTRGMAAGGTATQPKANKVALAEALKHKGQRSVWGAEGPKTFDCSGLVMYSYGKAGITTPRVAAAQFAAARAIPASRAVPGDLVFYFDSEGDVYHVGIYLSPGETFAAIDEQEGVDYQHLWDTSIISYGSFTHS